MPNHALSWLKRLALVWAIAIGLAFLVYLLAGCPPPSVCSPGAARCAETRAELCDASGRWRLVADCDKVKPTSKGWGCACQNERRCFCYPKGEGPER